MSRMIFSKKKARSPVPTFVFDVDTTDRDGASTIRVSVGGYDSGNVTADWGDGSEPTVQYAGFSVSHAYAKDVVCKMKLYYPGPIGEARTLYITYPYVP